MKETGFENMTNEELRQKAKTLKVITGMLAGVLLILFVVAAYESYTEGAFSVVLITPIALSSIVLINYGKIKKMDAELKSRS